MKIQPEPTGDSPGCRSRRLILTNDTFSTRKWRPLMVTYDGGKDAEGRKLLLDGVPQETTYAHNSLTGSIASDAPFTVGARSDGFPFDG